MWGVHSKRESGGVRECFAYTSGCEGFLLMLKGKNPERGQGQGLYTMRERLLKVGRESSQKGGGEKLLLKIEVGEQMCEGRERTQIKLRRRQWAKGLILEQTRGRRRKKTPQGRECKTRRVISINVFEMLVPSGGKSL